MIRRYRGRVIVLVLALLLAPACGKKAPPRVPVKPSPEAVSGFQAAVREGQISLIFSPPVKLATGDPVPADLTYQIDRKAGDAEPRAITVTDNDLTSSPGGQKIWTDSDVSREVEYRYRVRPAAGDLAGPWSKWAVVMVVTPPGSPGGLQAEAGDRQVILSWQPPSTGEPIGYLVERALEGEDFPLTPLTPDPVLGTTYLDRRVINGKVYRYRVRAVAGEAPSYQEGPPSTEVSARPADLDPPAPPSDLRTVISSRGVELVWEETPEPDTAGYLVYRRGMEGNWAPLTPTPVPDPFFRDETVKPGVRYVYRVTAVDTASPANESPPSKEVEVAIPGP